MKNQPTADQFREQLATAADEIVRLRILLDESIDKPMIGVVFAIGGMFGALLTWWAL